MLQNYILRTYINTDSPHTYPIQIAQSLYRLASDWTVRWSNPGGGEIFHTRPERPWEQPSLLHKGHIFFLQAVKLSGPGFEHPPTSSAKGKERVQLYLYSPSGPSLRVLV